MRRILTRLWIQDPNASSSEAVHQVLEALRAAVEAASSPHMGGERAASTFLSGQQSVEQRPQFMTKVRESSAEMHDRRESGSILPAQ
jgi:hypothetical protein